MNLEAVKTCFMLLYADLTEAAQQKKNHQLQSKVMNAATRRPFPVVSEPFIDIHSGV